ncbi:hypothetical protein [Oxobacter pfennigii]|nr:hypothetical protein [Oxobacter pfennigii]
MIIDYWDYYLDKLIKEALQEIYGKIEVPPFEEVWAEFLKRLAERENSQKVTVKLSDRIEKKDNVIYYPFREEH